MALRNLMGRRAALRELEIGDVLLWAVPSRDVTNEMRSMADAASKVGISITQRHMIAVSPKGDEIPMAAMTIERIL